MPGLDRSGPEGKGSMTGRGQGKCRGASDNPKESPESTDDSRGNGRGRRFGFGFRSGSGRGRGRGLGQGRS